MKEEGLSEKKALEVCRDLWTWMRDEEKISQDDKGGWPGWEINGGDIELMESFCPCCEYEKQLRGAGNIDCDRCLLYVLWPGGCELDKNSPFLKFSNHEGTTKDAQKIIDGCNKELEKLGA